MRLTRGLHTMIKETDIKIISYCESNGKYDLIIDGILVGKHYNIEEAIKQLQRLLLMVNQN